MVMYDVIYIYIYIQTIFDFEIKLNKNLKYKLIIMHNMFNICNFNFCVNQI